MSLNHLTAVGPLTYGLQLQQLQLSVCSHYIELINEAQLSL